MTTDNQSTLPIVTSYTGEVKLFKVTCGKTTLLNKWHNEGKQELFKFLTYCVSGSYSVADNYRPYKVIARNSSNKNLVYGVALIGEPGAPKVSKSDVSVTLKAHIAATQLARDESISSLVLCSREFKATAGTTVDDVSNGICAVFKLDESVTLKDDESLKIEWTFSFKDGSSTTAQR